MQEEGEGKNITFFGLNFLALFWVVLALVIRQQAKRAASLEFSLG